MPEKRSQRLPTARYTICMHTRHHKTFNILLANCWRICCRRRCHYCSRRLPPHAGGLPADRNGRRRPLNGRQGWRRRRPAPPGWRGTPGGAIPSPCAGRRSRSIWPPCIRSRSRWRGAHSSSKSEQKRKNEYWGSFYIFVRIRIHGPVPLTNGSGSDSFFQ